MGNSPPRPSMPKRQPIRQPLILLFILIFFVSCSKQLDSVADEDITKQKTGINQEFIKSLQSYDDYKTIVTIWSDDYKENFIDSVISQSESRCDSVRQVAAANYIIHKYLACDVFATKFEGESFMYVYNNMIYDLHPQHRIQTKCDGDVNIYGDSEALYKKANLFLLMVDDDIKRTICGECLITGKSQLIRDAFAEFLETFPYPYCSVLYELNRASSNLSVTRIYDGLIGNYDTIKFCWDDLNTEYRTSGRISFLKSIHSQLCRNAPIPGGGGGGGGDSGGGTNPPTDEEIDRSPKELMDEKKFVIFNPERSCLGGCKEILNNYGISNHGSTDAVHQVIELDGNNDLKYNYGKYETLLNCIDRHLNNNRPIIAGILVESYINTGNNDKVTSHFIVITGRGFDADQNMFYYTYMDTGRATPLEGCDKNNNRLYYNPNEVNLYDNKNYNNQLYQVTHVRPNDGNTTGTTSQLTMYN